MARAGTVYVDVRADTAAFARDMQRAAGDATRSLGSISAAGAKRVMSDVAGYAGAATLALGGLGAAAIKVTTDFDKAVSGVAAVANASEAELVQLREAALSAGAATSFSASEAAVAESELARAGLAVSDILGGALLGSLDLAAAGQLDLGKAAEISAQAMNIFGLAGDDVAHIADVLAAGANKSAADVGQLGDALRQGGLVAAQTGLSLEDTIGAFSLFADNALIGSDAGTSFKTTLQRLVPQSKQQAQAMDDLGLSFFDANGNFVGLEETAQRLQVALSDLSDEERSAALTRIFGSDAVRAASLLYEAGAEGVREYTEAVDDQGAAQRVAATQLDNFAGDLEEFSGSVETALIRIGDLGTSTLRGVVQGGTEIVNVFNDFATAPAFRAIEANLTRLGSVAGIRLGGFADQLADVLGSIDPSDVDRAFNTITDGLMAVREAADGLEPVIAGLGASFATMALRSIPLVGGLVPALSPLTGVLGGIVVGSDNAREAVKTFAERAADLGRSVGPDLLDALSGLADVLGDGIAVVLDEVGEAAIEVGEVLGPVLADAIREVTPIVGDLVDAGADLAADVLPLIASVIEDLAPLVVNVLGAGLSVAAEAMELLSENSVLLAAALGGLVAVKFGGTIASWASALGRLGANLATSATDFTTYFRVLRAEGASVGGALSGAAKETGGLSTGLIGLNPAVIGVTAAVTLGAIAYQKYASEKAQVKDLTDDLVEAVQQEQAAFESAEEARQREAFQNEDALDVANELGLSLSELSEIAADNAESFERASVWIGVSEGNMDDFRKTTEGMPDEVREITDAVAGLVENDDLDASDASRFFQAMKDLANSTADGIRNAKDEFESIALEAKDRGDLTASQFESLSKRIKEASTPEEVQAAFEDLFGYLSGVGESAADAADEVRALIDALDELGMVRRNVDELERDLLDARDRTAELFKDGVGLDRDTSEGRDRLDSIQREIEATERYAEELAKLDPTGQQAALALHAQRLALGDLADQGKITQEELAQLIELYGLTPETIETTVEADISAAEAGIDEITERLNNIPGGPDVDPVKAEIETLLNNGEYEAARVKLLWLERRYTATIDVEVDLESARRDLGYFQGTLAALTGQTRSIGLGFENIFGGPRASGGAVDPSMAYLVGEKGRELFIPNTAGVVVPNSITEKSLTGAQGSPSDIWFRSLVDAINAQTGRLEGALAGANQGPSFTLNQRNYGANGDETARRSMDANKALVASL